METVNHCIISQVLFIRSNNTILPRDQFFLIYFSKKRNNIVSTHNIQQPAFESVNYREKLFPWGFEKPSEHNECRELWCITNRTTNFATKPFTSRPPVNTIPELIRFWNARCHRRYTLILALRPFLPMKYYFLRTQSAIPFSLHRQTGWIVNFSKILISTARKRHGDHSRYRFTRSLRRVFLFLLFSFSSFPLRVSRLFFRKVFSIFVCIYMVIFSENF